MNNRSGMIGRLVIPDVDINVALFSGNSSMWQTYVDRQDSACYMYVVDFYGQDLIGDHVNQGFRGIKSASPYNTKAIIDWGDYKTTYTCTKVMKGYNASSYGLVDLSGFTVGGCNNGGICMYTCNSDNTVTITFWHPSGNSPHQHDWAEDYRSDERGYTAYTCCVCGWEEVQWDDWKNSIVD